MWPVDEGAHSGVFQQGVSNLYPLGLFHHLLCEFVQNLRLHKHPCAVTANLKHRRELPVCRGERRKGRRIPQVQAEKNTLYFYLFFKDVIYLFLETWEGRKRGRATSVCVCLLSTPHGEPWPTIQACALRGNRTRVLLVCRSVLNPLSHTSQGKKIHCICVKVTSIDETYLHMKRITHVIVRTSPHRTNYQPFEMKLPSSCD